MISLNGCRMLLEKFLICCMSISTRRCRFN